MSSIKSYVPFTPAYPPVGKGHIDSGQARHNPLDKTAGEDAEVASGKGGWKNASSDYRAHANRSRLDHKFLPSDKKIIDNAQANVGNLPPNTAYGPAILPSDHNAVDIPEVNVAIRHPNTAFRPAILPSDHNAVDDAQANAHREPIDFEIKSDGNDGWTKA